MKSIIFQGMYGVDPSTLTLAEIDKIIFKGRKPKVVTCGQSIVSAQDVIPVKDCNVEIKDT